MPDDQDGDKSQDATPHRRQQAMEQGHVAKSHDLTTSVLLVLGLSTLVWTGGGLAQFLMRYATEHLGSAELEAHGDFLYGQWLSVLWPLAQSLLPIFGLMFLGALAMELAQVGFLFLPERLMPDLTRLDPLQGVSRMFSLQNLVRLAFGLIKLAIVGAVAYAVAGNEWSTILNLSRRGVPEIGSYLAQLLVWSALKIAVALLILALLDYGFQRWQYEQDIKMTSQEVREEMKSLEGNPQVISRRRAAQRQMVLNRLSSTVPKADVVVTNPTELAIAIQYDPQTMAAPIVLAKGAGLLAKRIRELALENGIPIVEKKPLAQALYREVDVNHPIPSDKYAAVAEILAYVYRLKGKPIPAPPKAAA